MPKETAEKSSLSDRSSAHMAGTRPKEPRVKEREASPTTRAGIQAVRSLTVKMFNSFVRNSRRLSAESCASAHSFA